MNCPVCHADLIDTKKNVVVVCHACNNSLFAYKNKKKQFKLMPFHLNINVIGNQNINEELPDDDTDDFSEDEPDFEDSQFGPKI